MEGGHPGNGRRRELAGRASRFVAGGRPAAGPPEARDRFRPPRPEPRPGEACELCGEALGHQHRHVVHLDHRSLLCVCRACYLLFTRDGAAGGRYRAVPQRYAPDPSVPSERGAVGGLEIPVGVAFFFRNSQADQVCGLLPQPGRRHRVHARPPVWDEVLAANPSMAEAQSDVEAVPGPPRVTRGSSASWCRSTPATSWSAGCGPVEGLRRRPGGVGALDGFFDGSARAQRGPRRGRTVTELVFDCVGAAADRYGASPTLLLRLRVTETTGNGSTRSPSGARSGSSRSGAGTPMTTRNASRICSARPAMGGHAQAVPVRHGAVMIPGFEGATEVELPVPCTYDMEVARRSTSPPWATARSRCCCCSAGPGVHPGRDRVQRGAGAVAQGGDVPPARRGLAGDGGRPLPRQRLDPRWAARARPAAGVPVATDAAGWEDALDVLFRAAGEGNRDGCRGRRARGRVPLRAGPGGRRRHPLRGIRPLPLPGLGGQEPGPVAVRRPHAPSVRGV